MSKDPGCKAGTCQLHPRTGQPLPTGWRALRVTASNHGPVIDVLGLLFDPGLLAFYLGAWKGSVRFIVERCALGYVGFQLVLENNVGERVQVACSATHDHFKAGMQEHRGWVNP